MCRRWSSASIPEQSVTGKTTFMGDNIKSHMQKVIDNLVMLGEISLLDNVRSIMMTSDRHTPWHVEKRPTHRAVTRSIHTVQARFGRAQSKVRPS